MVNPIAQRPDVPYSALPSDDGETRDEALMCRPCEVSPPLQWDRLRSGFVEWSQYLEKVKRDNPHAYLSALEDRAHYYLEENSACYSEYTALLYAYSQFSRERALLLGLQTQFHKGEMSEADMVGLFRQGFRMFFYGHMLSEIHIDGGRGDHFLAQAFHYSPDFFLEENFVLSTCPAQIDAQPEKIDSHPYVVMDDIKAYFTCYGPAAFGQDGKLYPALMAVLRIPALVGWLQPYWQRASRDPDRTRAVWDDLKNTLHLPLIRSLLQFFPSADDAVMLPDAVTVYTHRVDSQDTFDQACEKHTGSEIDITYLKADDTWMIYHEETWNGVDVMEVKRDLLEADGVLPLSQLAACDLPIVLDVKPSQIHPNLQINDATIEALLDAIDAFNPEHLSPITIDSLDEAFLAHPCPRLTVFDRMVDSRIPRPRNPCRSLGGESAPTLPLRHPVPIRFRLHPTQNSP